MKTGTMWWNNERNVWAKMLPLVGGFSPVCDGRQAKRLALFPLQAPREEEEEEESHTDSNAKQGHNFCAAALGEMLGMGTEDEAGGR